MTVTPENSINEICLMLSVSLSSESGNLVKIETDHRSVFADGLPPNATICGNEMLNM